MSESKCGLTMSPNQAPGYPGIMIGERCACGSALWIDVSEVTCLTSKQVIDRR